MILVIALYALLASTFTLGKVLLYFLPPLLLIAVRMTLAGAILLTIDYFSTAKKRVFKISDFACLSLLSCIHIFIPYSSEFIALQYIDPSCAALMYNLSPFITALFSYIFFKESMTLKKWIGFGLGFAGILYFVKLDLSCLYVLEGVTIYNNAYIMLLLSVISASAGWVLVRYLMQYKNMSIAYINGIAMVLGGLQACIASCFFEATSVTMTSFTSSFWLLLGMVILIANILFYNLYGYLLKQYTATFLSFVGFITPLFTALYDYLFLGIPIHVDFFITIGIVGCGIYLFYQEELKQGYIVS